LIFSYGLAVISLFSDAEARNVCNIHSLPNEQHLITRHGSTIDCTYLWDLRFLKYPILCYGTFDNSKNIGFRSMNKYCFLDLPSNVMSCYHIDGILRLWNIENGQNLAETSELNGGIYSEKWSINHNKPGIIGLNNGKVVWLPLRSE